MPWHDAAPAARVWTAATFLSTNLAVYKRPFQRYSGVFPRCSSRVTRNKKDIQSMALAAPFAVILCKFKDNETEPK